MEIIKKNQIVVECPACKSILKPSREDFVTTILNYVGIYCPVCSKWIWICDWLGKHNENIRMKIEEDKNHG